MTAKKKTAAQLDREIADALAGTPARDAWKIGDKVAL